MEKIELLEVESPRLYFRRLRATDLDLVSSVLQDAETMAAWERPYDRSETLDWIADMLHRYMTDGLGYVAVFEKQTDEPVALCGLLRERLDNRKPVVSLGCIVHSVKRYRGYGRECLSAMLSCAFARLSLDRVTAFVRLDNLGALQTAAACGMKPVGRCERVHAGRAVPHVILAIENPLENGALPGTE